ncbi:isopentenyl diphosphate isomerase/L-lactate dehydrogenase-like FMN-dependent dehydrogenase [Natronobacillus azotifigens]|uniref:L-lactate oxidase n=1 Tax=Natronobacillus azotifigens TaxID=472978 RepID=A0A9J6RD85_9BACI|nr:alpha-hydroxy-acid oxidizing protein [Natronobacillus azotifigens]MCZ0703511.1 alpha-hydroxy-acid oxidizing protein [Natronobacillus azotifigens]
MTILKLEPSSEPFTYEQWEELAKTKLTKGAFDYVQSGSGAEETLIKNREVFSQWDLLPYVLTNVEERDLSTNLLNRKIAAPFLLAPVGFQTVVHPDGERASASSASKLNIPYITSTVSSVALEEVSKIMQDTPHYFQLYWPNDDDVATSLVKRAESVGYDAIVVTVDTPLLGWREKDLHNGYFPMETGAGMANFVSDPVFQAKYNSDDLLEDSELIPVIRNILLKQNLTWEKLAWLREQTSLPILLKGILRADDAAKAVQFGIDAIIVSNHGGRQLDGVRSSLSALPAIVEEVNGEIPVLVDGGIRRGSDIIKAIALGADAVLLGRPYVYGLANGEAGVTDVLKNLLSDLDTSLAIVGIPTIQMIDQSIIEEKR